MGLFGNKTSKTLKENNANKAQILTMLQNMQMNCKDAASLDAIRRLTQELRQQPESADERIADIDIAIIDLLEKTSGYVLKGQYGAVAANVGKAYDLACDRHVYCQSGGMLGKKEQKEKEKNDKRLEKLKKKHDVKKSRAEELQEEVDETFAKIEALDREFERLREQYNDNKNNVSVITRAEANRKERQATEGYLTSLKQELAREGAMDLLENVNKKEQSMLDNKKRASDVSIQREIDKRNALNEERKNTEETVSGLNAALGSMGTSSSAMGNVFEQQSAATGANVFGETTGAGQSASFGSFDTSAIGTGKMTGELRRAHQALEQSLGRYEQQMEEAKDTLADLDAELRPLLLKRKTASPSDCLTLDGEIDRIQAKRGSAQNRIQRLNQAMAQLSDRQALVERLETVNDLTATDARISELTGGRFTDFEGIAAYLNSTTKEANQKGEDIGIALNIADSEMIQQKSASAAGAIFNDSVEKDKDKYASLEAELGLQTV